MPLTGGSGGGSGGGDASAANQSTQITAEQAILAKIIAAPATEATLAAASAKLPAALGSAAAASSLAVAASTEDIARQGIITETAPASDTASSGQNGRLQRIAQRLSSLISLLPSALGSTAAASSLAVTQSTEDVARQGIITETAPASDTASSGVNGRLQRVAQRITSLIALYPASLGSKAAASSFAVTQSTEDAAQLGSLTEAAPASDTASSGLNGRLQRIAQNITANTAAALATGANIIGKVGIDQTTPGTTNLVQARGNDGILTCTTTITRPADTNAYAANDALSNSTSSPTAGGGTFTSAARASGKSVVLTDVLIVSSNAPGTALQGVLWIFDTAPTAINDNAAFSVSDAEMLTAVAQVPFTLVTLGANSQVHVQNLNIGILTVGSANLRFLVQVVNAYTPASAETLTFRAKFVPVD